MNEFATFRGLSRDDFALLAEMEARSHLTTDPDFGVTVVGRHAWDERTLAEVWGENDTRGWVVEGGNGNAVAYVIWEADPDGSALLIRRILVHPEFRRSDFGRTILWKLYQRIVRHPTRKTLRAYVREDDLETCGWFKKMGFAARLVRRGYDEELDAVEFSFTTQEHAGDAS